MNISETNNGARKVYNSIRAISLTGKYGKTNLVATDNPEYIKRARLLAQLAAYVQCYAAYGAGVLMYNMARVEETYAKNALKESANELKHVFFGLSDQVFKAAVKSNSNFIRQAPYSVGEKVPSSTGATTCVYNIIRLAHQIQDKKDDFISTIARKTLTAVLDSYRSIIKGARAIHVLDVPESFEEWTSRVRIKEAYNFAATRNNKSNVIDSCKDFLRDHSKKCEELPTENLEDQPVFITHQDNLHVNTGNEFLILL